MSRVNRADAEVTYSEEDRYAIKVLRGPLDRPTHAAMLERVAHPGREKDPTLRMGPSTAFMSPIIQLSLSMLGTACIKGQATGRYPPEAHWWGDLVVAFDLSDGGGERWHMLAQNVSCAASAGIRIEAIEALRRGDTDSLTETELQYVTFVRQVLAGSVSEECWAKEVRLIGNERGVFELTVLYLYLNLIMRVGQALGLMPDLTSKQFDEIIAGLRAGSWPMIDVGEYSRAFDQDIFTRIRID